MRLDQIKAVATIGFVSLLFLYLFGTFTWRRRCRKCRRWYGGRVHSVTVTGGKTVSTNQLEHTPDGLQRVRRSTKSGIRHVRYRCRRCGDYWVHSGAFRTSKTY